MQTHVEQMQQAAHNIMKVGSLSWGSHRDVAFRGTYWIFVNLSTGDSMLGGISTNLFSLPRSIMTVLSGVAFFWWQEHVFWKHYWLSQA